MWMSALKTSLSQYQGLCWAVLLKARSMIFKKSNFKCNLRPGSLVVRFQKVKMMSLGRQSRIPKSTRSQTIGQRRVSLITTRKKKTKIPQMTWSWIAHRFQSRRTPMRRMISRIFRDSSTKWRCLLYLSRDLSLPIVNLRILEIWVIRWWINSCPKARTHLKSNPLTCQAQVSTFLIT